MGFYDDLGQAASGSVGGLAGLAGGPIGLAASLGGGIVGGILNRKTAERQRRLANDELRLRQQQLALEAARFNRGAPGARMSDALRGDVLAGVQPFQLTGEGRTLGATGGLTPALISAGSRRLGQDISRRAMLSQLTQGGRAPLPAGPARQAQNQPGQVVGLPEQTDLEALTAAGPPSGEPAAPTGRGWRARLQAEAARRTAVLPMPDPYSFLPFGGAPVRGGPDSLWPNTVWG